MASPDKIVSPETCNLVNGVVVPIPTFPSCVILNLSEPLVSTAKVSPEGNLIEVFSSVV